MSITLPAAGAKVDGKSGVVVAKASDNVGVVGVQFRLNGVKLGAEDRAAPYRIQWDSRTVPDGWHRLTALARDKAGNKTTAAIRVKVANLKVVVSKPVEGATISGRYVVRANVSGLPEGAKAGAGSTPRAKSPTFGPAASEASSGADAPGATTVASGPSGGFTRSAAGEASLLLSSYVPVADTEVRADLPTVNFGTAAAMGLDGDPVRRALLRFNVSVPPGEVVSSATLRLFVSSTHTASIFVNQVASTTWGETTTNFNNAPAVGAQVAASGPLTANSYVSMNVTSLITGSGLVSMAVTRADTVPIAISSREATADRQPQLIVETVSAGDTTPPTVSMSAPNAGATVGGSAVVVSANASDNVGVVGVQFKLDGADLGSEDTSAPYSVTWNTTSAANGPHTLTAVARDAANNTATASEIVVNVTNGSATYLPVADTEVRADVPTVNFGTATAMGLDGDPVRMALLRFNVSVPPGEVVSSATLRLFVSSTHAADLFVNQVTSTTWGETTTNFNNAPAIGAQVAASGPLTANSYVSMNVTPLITGSGLVSMAVRRADTVPIAVSSREAAADRQPQLVVTTVPAGDTTPPTVSMTAPNAGATVGGSAVIVSANASDNVGVVGVQFRLDGANLGAEDTSAPYSVAWNTTTVANGPHTLTAVARDAANNIATASEIVVNVTNGSITFLPVADTEVRADLPTVNFGTAAAMGLDGDPVRRALLRFNVSVPPGEVVSSATLRLFVSSTHPASIFINQMGDNSWGETTTNFNNAPALGAQVAASGALTANSYVSMNVAPLIAGSGPVSMAVTRADTVPIAISSREATADRQPQLVISTVPASDTIPPTVEMTAPVSGAVVAGGIPTSAAASDNVGVAGVQFKLDGANLGAEVTAAPYAFTWDTTGAANGPHTLTAVARDTAGNTATSAPVDVTVSNVSVALTAPATGATVSGTLVPVSASASANVIAVQFKLDGVNLGPEDTTTPYSVDWDTTVASDGPHTLTAVARDSVNNTATSAPVDVTVNNLTGALTAPAEGATVSGTAVTVSANAGGTVAGVQFKLDGVNLGAEDTTAPYSVEWNTTTATNGPHVLTAVVRGPSNNTVTSAPVNVTVSNLTASLTAPTEGATISGATVAVSANAGGNVAGVQFQVDGANLGTEDTSVPYETVWDTTTTANGPHVLTAVVRDPSNNTVTSAPVNVTVSNATIAVTAPTEGATVSGTTVAVSANAGGNVAGVQFKLDDANLGAEDTSVPYEIVWDTTTSANGPHVLTAVVRDPSNNTVTSAPVNVTVSNLTAALTAPTEGATVSGTTVTVSANAAGNVAGVQFKLDGANLGIEDTSVPYETVWDTTTTGNGPHALTAVVRDPSNNTVTSVPVNVTVANLSVAITTPAPNAGVSGSAVTVSAGASANVVGVQFKLDGENLGAEDTSTPFGIVWDTTNAQHGLRRITAVARDSTGTTATADPVKVWVTNPTTQTLAAVADTELRSDSANSNFGNLTAIVLDGSPVRTALMRFNVSVPPGEVVTSATLRLFMTSSSSAAVFVRRLQDPAWGETTATYNNAPAIGDQVAASGAITGNAYLPINVTSLVTGSGQVNMAVTRTNTAAITFNSREAGSNTPQLVVVTTPVVDTTPPVVAISSPLTGAGVAGSEVAVSANVSDNVGVAGVQFKLNGANLGAEDASAPFGIEWDTTGLANGPYTLTAVARDASENSTTSAPVDVTVANMSVAVTAPAPAALVSGPAVAVSADASANVVGVQFQLDGDNIGAEDTSVPYGISWDTIPFSNGFHELTAVARNNFGNLAVSSPVMVKVANPITSTFEPVVDAEVNSASPDTNWGWASWLVADGENPIRLSYLTFNVNLPAGETVSSATLRVFTTGGASSASTFVHQVADTEWREMGITYNNRPPLGPQVGASGPYAGNSYVSIDITSAVSGGGLYSFALTRISPEANQFNSREAASNRPQLVIVTTPDSSGPPNPPDPAPDVPPTVSADPLSTWQINGVVWSQVVVGNIVYATGSFTKARPPGVPVGGPGEVDAQHIFAYNILTGERVASFNHSLNAQGLVIAASPDGSRIYVGGDFTAVDGLARGHVASFRTATGNLDLNFTPNVQGQVQALAVSPTKVYVGGAFGGVGGQTRTSLAALDAINGSLLPWAPFVSDDGDPSKIYAMVLAPDRSRVIIGGTFSNINGVTATGMGSVDANSGATLPWVANQTIRNNGIISSLRTDGEQIYGSGYVFISGGGTGNFEGSFAADPKTGAITVVNDCHGDSYDVFPIGPVLYVATHAHECIWIGSFPDTNPRVRWMRGLAMTIAPHTVNVGPDSYGWSYDGLPASKLLHFFPQFAVGTYTGVFQGPYSVTGNKDYVVWGGEFPSVNGVAQQGLVRMAVRSIAPNLRGPTYNVTPSIPNHSAVTATSTASGTVNVSFRAAWDYDDEVLNYGVFRNGGAVFHTTQMASNFWTFPTATVTDTGLTPGSTAFYRVRITDPYGNTQFSLQSNTVTVCCSGGALMADLAVQQRINGLKSAINPVEASIGQVKPKRVYVDARASKEYRPVTRKGRKTGTRVPSASTNLRAASAVRYSDRVMVGVKKMVRSREIDQGRGSFPGRPYAALTFTITNHSGRPIDLNQVVVSAEYGSPARIASAVYNSPLTQEFSGILRSGDSATATYAFAVPPGSRNVSAIVDFDEKHAPARFVSRGKSRNR